MQGNLRIAALYTDFVVQDLHPELGRRFPRSTELLLSPSEDAQNA